VRTAWGSEYSGASKWRIASEIQVVFIWTLDLVGPVPSIRGVMNSEEWLEKAERLRSTLAYLREAHRPCAAASTVDFAPPEALERVAIAHWLRQEFSAHPPEDTQTLPLFTGSGP
jgi:hypothetical protein